MARVVFTPSGLSGAVRAGSTVLDAARQLGVDLDSVCGGRGLCGRCQVVPSVGEFPKWAISAGSAALSPTDAMERAYEGRRALEPPSRLGCAACVLGDAVIDVPSESQVHHPVVRKHVNVDGLTIDPRFALVYLELEDATLDGQESALDLVARAADAQHGVVVKGASPMVLRSIHHAVAKGENRVTAAIRLLGLASVREAAAVLPRTGSIVAIWPGFVDGLYGVAVDVGSTTIAGHLCDLATGEVVSSLGRMNPQIRFGEDLMSRVSYVMMNPGGEKALTTAVRTALDDLIGDLLADAGLARTNVAEVVIVGNPIMHHLVLGIDPTPLGQAPFVLATAQAISLSAAELDLDLPWSSVYLGPCIAGHVGADTAGAILAEGPHRSDAMQLLVDVGTNAEIVLGNKDRQFAASSPTGPAFEGAQISCGQRATVGAIERVRINRETYVPRFKVIGSDLWSDDAGFEAATAGIEISGVCGSGIIEVIAELYLAGVIDADGLIGGGSPGVEADGRTFAYVLYEQGETRLRVTQNDVRQIQLAKGALRAGIDLLIEHAGSPIVDDIRLAGAFGAHIDPLYAMVLGLVPDCPLEGVRSVGNAAGNGAVRALLSAAQRSEMEAAVRRVVKIETATEPRFQELFVGAMAFPHATALSPHLAALVDLPVRAESAAGSRSGRRRRSS